MTELINLQNHFLIAMPTLQGSYFSHAVTYICEHNDEGAMGIVINQPSRMNVRELLAQTDEGLEVAPNRAEQIVLTGGPVAQERGFVLHSIEGEWASSMNLSPFVAVTTSKDILTAIGKDTGPANATICLGYAGWSAGQLEQEIQENAWLTVEADPEILFATPIHRRWQAAVHKLGIDVWQLTPESGHA